MGALVTTNDVARAPILSNRPGKWQKRGVDQLEEVDPVQLLPPQILGLLAFILMTKWAEGMILGPYLL